MGNEVNRHLSIIYEKLKENYKYINNENFDSIKFHNADSGYVRYWIKNETEQEKEIKNNLFNILRERKIEWNELKSMCSSYCYIQFIQEKDQKEYEKIADFSSIIGYILS